MPVIDSAIVFVVSALIGGLGLYVGGRVIAGVEDYGHAVVGVTEFGAVGVPGA